MHSMLKGELRADFNYDTSLRNKVGSKTRSHGFLYCLCIQQGKPTGFLFMYTQIPDTQICMGHGKNNLHEVLKMMVALPYT